MCAGEAIVRHYPNSYKLKTQIIDEKHKDLRTLILGNSHNYYGINPKVIGEHAFNLSNVLQTPEYDYFLLNKYYGEKSYKLKNVIIVVDFTGFFTDALEVEDPARAAYYRIYMGYDKHSWLSKYGFELFNSQQYRSKFVPALKYLFTGKYSLNCDSAGFGIPTTRPNEVTLEHMRRTCNKVFNNAEVKMGNVKYNHYYLAKIGEFCKQRGIRLILIQTPLWSEFYNKIGKEELSAIHAEMEFMSHEYGAVSHNYMNDSRFSGFENFSDASHLSRLGADKFTRILMEDFAGL